MPKCVAVRRISSLVGLCSKSSSANANAETSVERAKEDKPQLY